MGSGHAPLQLVSQWDSLFVFSFKFLYIGTCILCLGERRLKGLLSSIENKLIYLFLLSIFYFLSFTLCFFPLFLFDEVSYLKIKQL